MKKMSAVLFSGVLIAASGSALAATAEETYKTYCQACHAAGVAGAPKTGDKEAWAPRIAKGDDAMLATAIKGLNAMPPKGTCMACSDDELKAAIDYIVSQSK